MNDESKPRPVSDDVDSLISSSFDEPLTESGIERIEAELAKSAEARQWYAEAAQMHADLSALQGMREVCRLVHDEFPAEEVLSIGTKHVAAGSLGWPLGQRRLSPAFAAAVLLVLGIGLGCGVGLFAATIIYVRPEFLPIPWNWKVGNDVVAKIEATDSVAWQPADESPETPPTRGIRIGQQIRLAEGRLLLSFRNGVNAILRGPAVFEVRSANAGKLYSGQLAATAPRDISTFHVETPAGRFQFGPGHFGIEVGNVDGVDASTFHAFSGIAPAKPTAQFVNNLGVEFGIIEGQAIQFRNNGEMREVSLASPNDFESRLPLPRRELFTGNVIYLGNLFDDSTSASLAEAMRTDTYQAAGETIDLGIAAVQDGGLDVDVSLAEDGVLFNLVNVGGGGPKVLGLPGNDTRRSVFGAPIRTTGIDFGPNSPNHKVEEGIGMSTNELMTFDLRELRQAGELGDREMRFIVDRAGINDRSNDDVALNLETTRMLASARFVVIVSTEDQVLSAYVDGKRYDVVERNGVFLFDLDSDALSPVLRRNGTFVSFDVPIPPDARYLTLATTMHDNECHDHAVFSGARLELSSSTKGSIAAKLAPSGVSAREILPAPSLNTPRLKAH